MKTRAALLAVAVTLTLAVGCGRQQPDTAAGGDAEPDTSLDGRTFLSTGATGRDLVPDTRVRLAFAEGTVNANAGCNHLGARVRIDDARLIANQVVGTDMGCSPALMDQDAWLVGLLESSPQLILEGDTLTLRGPDGAILELVDRRIAEPDRPLVGTTWRLDAIVEGTAAEGVASSVPADVTSTLRISEDGQLSLAPGCNSGGADVQVSEGLLRLGPVVTTRMACAEEQMRIEEAVLTVLTRGEVDYSIDGDALTLTNGGLSLVYRAD